MTADPWLLDLGCGPGGLSVGYHRAGFNILGVDIKPQPRYPFRFVQADMFQAIDTWNLSRFAAIVTSPPCQDHMKTPTHNQKLHGTGWMLAAMRKRLQAQPLPWIIENVVGAPMRPDYELCGCMFPELHCRSKRWFETSWQGFELIPPHDHSREVLNRFRTMHGPYFRRTGRVPTRRQVAAAMGIDWTAGSEHQQAVPPPFGEFMGKRLMQVISEGKGIVYADR